MMRISDDAMRRLRLIADHPDLSGTRYEIVDFVGRGGMGAVYRAHDRELDRVVALKVLATEQAGADAVSRMRTEARILARLEHPGIVPVHDVDMLADGRIFYAMKLVQGSRLDRYAKGAPDLSDRLRVFVRICESVAFAHSHGVIHRDLKPHNIMVGAFGEVLVMDWGVAKLMTPAETVDTAAPTLPANPDAGQGHQTQPGSVLGTPGYMAPEQERGETSLVDYRADVYALGAILRDLGDTVSKPPKRLAAIIRKAMAEKREDRFPSVEALQRDVTRFSSGLSIDAYSEGPLEKMWRVIVRHKTPVLLILAYLFMRILLFFFNQG